MTIAELDRFLADHFPQAQGFGVVEELGEHRTRLRLPFDASQLRPGGTISGPTLMALADTAMYFLVLASVGPVALAVTTSLNMTFLRRPAPRDVIAEVRRLKLGRRLAVGDVLIYSEDDPAPVAHAVVTYALPPREPSA